MVRVPALLAFSLLVASASAAPWRVKARATRVERASNAFRAGFERQIADYGWGKLREGADAKARVRRLDEALERLRRAADDRRPLKGRDEMVAVLARARNVDLVFRRHPEIAGVSRPRWARLRTEISGLARVFDLRPLASRF